MDGTTFGQYLLKERIAKGGMAEIFAAERVGARDFRREVCIKRILPNLGHDRAFVEMFIDEARICSRLRHSNIVAIDDFGEIDGQLYACMEWVNGVDASKVARALVGGGRLFPVDAAFFVAAEVLRALEYAHGKRDGGRQLQIVHRDVSPHNVLISYVGEVKLTDFGIARAASRLHQTQGDVVKGKLAYMAPEQALGKPIDGRVDLFAVGVMLYELLAGRRPYAGPHHDIVLAAIQGQRTPLRVLRPELSDEMVAVVDRLLEPDADRRFLNASDALDAIAALPLGTGARTLAALMSELYPNQGSVVTPRLSAPTPIGGALAQTVPATPAATLSVGPSALAGPNGTEVSPRPAAPAPPPLPVPPVPAPHAPSAGRRGLVIALGLIAFLSLLSTVALASFLVAQRVDPAPPTAQPAPQVVAPAPRAPAPQPPAPQPPAPQSPAVHAPASQPPAPQPPASLSVVPVPWGRVTVDGRAVAPRQWVSLAPGAHRVVVRQDGGASASRTVTLAPGQRLALTIPVQ